MKISTDVKKIFRPLYNYPFFDHLRAYFNIRPPLFIRPLSKKAAISDLFPWRSDDFFDTRFDLMNIPSLVVPEGSLRDIVTLVFFNSEGEEILRYIQKLKPFENKILVLGLTFKENVTDLRNTKIIDLIRSLKKKGHKVCVNDPYACQKEVKKMNLKLTMLSKKEKYDTIILAVAHDNYKKLNYSFFNKKLNKNSKVFDLKAIWNKKRFPKKVEYIPL
mgnify:CR=1 FL=1